MRNPFRKRTSAVRPPSGAPARRKQRLHGMGCTLRRGLKSTVTFLRRAVPYMLRTVGLLCLAGALTLTLALTVSLGMVDVTKEQILTADELTATLATEDYDCILVLGAGLRADGSPSDMLHDRVATACGLYAAEAGIPLLMSGDHTGDYNEVAAMKALAIDLGVPSEDVFLDHDGNSTYESIYRAKEIFGADKMVIVTQEYHLYRALYIARELGVEAVGVPADLRPYRGQTKYELREMLARFKDLFTAARGDYEGEPASPVDLGGIGDLT